MTSFWHKSEIKKNRSRQKTQIINQNFIQKAINCHVQGDLENAEKSYRIAIGHGFLDATIYSDLGVICIFSDSYLTKASKSNQITAKMKAPPTSFPIASREASGVVFFGGTCSIREHLYFPPPNNGNESWNHRALW